jgi:hypothetical protein
VEPGEARRRTDDRLVGFVSEVERIGHDPGAVRAGFVEQLERVGE